MESLLDRIVDHQLDSDDRSGLTHSVLFISSIDKSETGITYNTINSLSFN